MTDLAESPANTLCKSCGMCCNGHLFIWAKLRPFELDPAEALGMHVYRSDPTQRGFSQPCPLWQGQCTIYSSPHYPRVCRAYKCKLLKELLAENISAPDALAKVEQVQGMIHELETLLPVSTKNNFRERLVEHIEAFQSLAGGEKLEPEFQAKAHTLLTFYEQVFGVDDLLEPPRKAH